MTRFALAGTLLVLADAALATPCVYLGNKVDYINCIAVQAGDNEDRLDLVEGDVADLDARVSTLESGSVTTGAVSIAGAALRPDRPGNELGGLSNGSVYAYDLGDTFTFASLSLPDGATLTRFDCTIKDEDSTAYLQANLLRADLDDPSVFSSDYIGGAYTFPANNSPDYIRYGNVTDAAFSVVDNASFTYYIRVDFLDVTSTFATVGLMGCSVEYTR
jgi:hypothetical protein